MPKTYTFGALGLTQPNIKLMPFPEPSRMLEQLQVQIAMAEQAMLHAFLVPDYVLRGETHPTIDGDYEEIMPLAIEGPK